MRITNNMLINNMINYMGNNLTRMDRFQNQLATGKKINVPSDDPVVAARALKLRTDVAEVDQFQRNVKDAQSWLEITEDSLAKIGDVFQRTRELAVQAANGTNTADDTRKVGEEVKQLRTQLIHLGNATYAGRYVFSGYKTDAPLLDEATGRFVTAVNNSENIKFEIGIGDSMEINVTGGDLFHLGANAVGDTAGIVTAPNNIGSLVITGANNTLDITVDGENQVVTITPGTYSSSYTLATEIQTRINNATVAVKDVSVGVVNGKLQITSGTKGVTSSIQINPSSAAANMGFPVTPVVNNGVNGQVGSLIQDFDNFITALGTADTANIELMIGRMDVQMNNLLRIRADVGARVNRVELTNNRLDSDTINFTKLMSENEDVDMAETIMNLKNEENVYRSSLAGGARIIMPTLIDFLR